MKKNYVYKNRPDPVFKKILLVMKLTMVIVLISMLHVSATVYSQATKLTLDMKETTIKEVLQEIESISKFRFIYQNEEVDLNKKINAKFENDAIEKILNKLFEGENINYSITATNLILIKPGQQLVNEKFRHWVDEEMVQQKTITGKVSDQSGQPLPGVTVVVKGTTQGTVTNAYGEYSLTNIPDEATLLFSFVGMRMQEVIVGIQSSINIVMEQETIGIEEVVAIGYGTVRKSDLTGSVTHIKADQFSTQQSTNVLEYLSGTVAGFNSNMGTTASGGGSMEIRGPTSLAANNNPLIVLDGVIYYGSLNDINPSDIETIDVLKDASAAAVYGARAASGVLIITTKKGTGERPTINFSSQTGLTGLTKQLQFMRPEEFMAARGEYWTQVNRTAPAYYYVNPKNLPPGISLEDWKNYDINPPDDITDIYLTRINAQEIEKQNYLKGETIDWYDEIMRNGLRQNYDLNLSGRYHALSYYWSIGYANNQGVILGDDFDAVRSRLNIDAKVNDFINVGVNLQFSDRDDSSVPASLEYAKRASPYGSIYEPDGITIKNYPHDDNISHNPFANYYHQDRLSNVQNLFANIHGEILLPFGFAYKVSFVNRYQWSKNFNFFPSTIPDGLATNGRGTRVLQTNYDWMLDNLLTWKRKFGAHSFDFTFLYNLEKNQGWRESMTNTLFTPSEALSFHQLEGGSNPQISNNDTYSTGNALMARINYGLMNRYLLTVSWRRDGYSAFGQENPYATFPAVALAWKVSDEGFFNVDWVNELKLRTSWGVNGNRDIGIYDALAQLATNQYQFGTTVATGIYSASMANSQLKWERTEAFNVGLDLGLLGDRIQATLDYYNMKTNDLLLNRSLPSIIGYTNVISNLGELANKGYEMSVSSVNIKNNGRFGWRSNVVFSFNRNKINKLYGEMVDILDEDGNVIGQKEADDPSSGWFIGQSIDRIWGFNVLGIWQLDEAEQAAQFAQLPGDPRIQDANEDGKLTVEDRVFLQYRRPRYRFGFRNDFTIMKNIEVAMFIRADLGHYSANGLYKPGMQPHRLNDYSVPYWTSENPTNKYTRLEALSPVPYSIYGSRGFVRLQDISISYMFPENLLERIPVRNLKMYVSSRNLLTFTNWTNWDPESGSSPMPKFYTFGLNITL